MRQNAEMCAACSRNAKFTRGRKEYVGVAKSMKHEIQDS